MYYIILVRETEATMLSNVIETSPLLR